MSCSGVSGTWTCPAGSSCDYENGGCIEVPTGRGSSSEAAPVASPTETPSSDTFVSSETFADTSTSTDTFQAESTSVDSFTATATTPAAATVVATTSAQPTHTSGAGLVNTNIDGVLGMFVLVVVGRALGF